MLIIFYGKVIFYRVYVQIFLPSILQASHANWRQGYFCWLSKQMKNQRKSFNINTIFYLYFSCKNLLFVNTCLQCHVTVIVLEAKVCICQKKINYRFAGELDTYYLHWYCLNYTNFMELIKYYTVSDFILIL